MRFVLCSTGRLLPFGLGCVDDFGDIVEVPREAEQRAWYFLGVWRALEEM